MLHHVPKPSRDERKAREAIKRQARRRQRTIASMNRRRTSYGGHGGDKFNREIRKRDGGVCIWCENPIAQPVDVHHIRERVGMGGRRTSSVNYEENAACLCRWTCHPLADVRKITPTQLEERLAFKHDYIYEHSA